MNKVSSHPSLSTNSLLVDAETLRMQELAQKKKRRLERNRASARECRKRKKEKKLLLRQQLAQLEAENLQLRLKLQVGNESDTHDTQIAIVTTKLNEMINEGASETDIEKKIQELKERFSDYGRDRRSAIDFHINQLRRCLQPTQTTRAILWLMSLAPKFYEITTGSNDSHVSSSYPTPSSSGFPSSSAAAAVGESNNELMALWYSLLEEIRPDKGQRTLMISYTTPSEKEEDPFTKIRRVTDTCNQTLDKIVEFICNKNDNLDQEMTNIQSVLSPRQIAKFILWIDKNPAVMQMLEALWPHVTSSTTTSSQSPTNSSYSPSKSFSVSHSNSNLTGLEDHDEGDDSDEMSTGSES
jgi:hypothetical protein